METLIEREALIKGESQSDVSRHPDKETDPHASHPKPVGRLRRIVVLLARLLPMMRPHRRQFFKVFALLIVTTALFHELENRMVREREYRRLFENHEPGRQERVSGDLNRLLG